MIKRKKQGKVRNATPIIIDNIHFKSKLEGYCYTKLKEAHIPTEYEPTHFTLLPAFTYDGENIRKMAVDQKKMLSYNIFDKRAVGQCTPDRRIKLLTKNSA